MAIRIIEPDCLIYEMPKTGTTFVRRMLEELNIAHQVEPVTEKSCPRHSPWWCYAPARKMAVIVRHPISWYESFYKYHRFGSTVEAGRQVSAPHRLVFNPELWYPHKLFWHRSGEFGMPFDIWIDRIIQFYPSAYTRLVDTFAGPLSCPKMNFTLRTETLASDLVGLLESLGFKDFDRSVVYESQKENESLGEIQWKVYHRNKVLEMEQAVIRRFYE